MIGSDRIREALERNVKAVTLRPSLAQGTARTRVRLKPGLECELEEGPWKMTIGMSEKSGGTNAGPNPGVLGRGALASCLAIGYGLWASRLGVPIASLDVEVQADYDGRGELGVAADVAPGYSQIRYLVTVESPASREDVLRVLDTADRYSPYLDVFTRPNEIVRSVDITVK
jgi:uncharacterized OsmC-like protein